MKKLVFTLALVVTGWTAQAQQLPLVSNYLNTAHLFNPAFSGLDGKTEITVLNRRQWTDIQGAPETQFMAFNGNREDLKFGYSGYAFNDVTDIVSRAGFYGSYAWHVKFTDQNSLSLGLGAGYVNNTINVGGIRVQDDLDPVLFSALNRGKFDLNFGFNLKFGDFSFGAAVPNILAPKVDFSDNYVISPFQYQYMRHYVVNTQYDVNLQKGLMTLSPFVTVRANEVTIPQVDAGLMFNHKEYFFIGAAYRSSYAVTANTGVHLTENITMGYAYDFSLNTYGFTLGNSHEFMLRYSFGESKKDKRLENELKKLKDRQRRQSEDLEDLLNDRLDDFKDETSQQQKEFIEAEKNRAITAEALLAEELKKEVSERISSDEANNAAINSLIKGYDSNQYAGNVVPGSSGYYVTAGVFGSVTNANNLEARLSKQGFASDVFHDPGNNMYYVFLLKFSTYESAKQAQGSGFNGQYNGKLWIKAM
ncbi:MAG: PorP/SprF family type IX secretion system membrane protein [Schleiferiaceae bacterium]|nr:PorP/SprF family type IX secretion system membrane protein [Schleiferiaceae bacterium]